MRRILPPLVFLIATAAAAQILFDPPAPTTQSYAFLQVGLVWGDGCVPIDPRVGVDRAVITVTFFPSRSGCIAAPVPWRTRVALGVLPAGVYQVIVGYADDYRGPWELFRDTLIVRDASVVVSPTAIPANVSGQRVFIQINADAPPIPAPATGMTVTFGDVPADRRTLSHSERNVISAVAPPGSGTVDVKMVWPDGTRVTGIAAFTYFDPDREPDRSIFEPVLFPLSYEGRGALGTTWTTENLMTPSFNTPVYVRESGRLKAWQFPMRPSMSPAGIVVWALRGTSEGFEFSSRIRETFRGASIGVEIPVVRPDGFRRGTVRLMNVAHGPNSRVTLRIYALGDAPLKTYVSFVGGAKSLETTLLPVENSGLLFAAVDLSSAPALRSADSMVSIDIGTGQLLREIWAMASTTDNETQHVTVNWPR